MLRFRLMKSTHHKKRSDGTMQTYYTYHLAIPPTYAQELLKRFEGKTVKVTLIIEEVRV